MPLTLVGAGNGVPSAVGDTPILCWAVSIGNRTVPDMIPWAVLISLGIADSGR